MRIPTLPLRKSVSDKWLEKCHKSLDVYLQKVMNLEIVDENYVRDTFQVVNGSNINPKYCILISNLFQALGVIGVWKKDFYPGSIDPITSLKIYGKAQKVKMAKNCLHYLIDGMENYFEVHVQVLRKKRHSRRTRRIKLIHEVDARKRTNQNIMNKLMVIEYNLFCFNKLACGKLRLDSQEKLAIIQIIRELETIDYRNYRGMKKPSVKSMYSRKNTIQLNRLV